jgi:hypothetical protein
MQEGNDMKNRNTNRQQITPRFLRIACVATLATVFTIALPHVGRAGQAARTDKSARADVIAPDVPAKLEVEAPNVPFLLGHGVGTQNYVCVPVATGGVGFVLFTPQATLFGDDFEQVTTHFFGPNPVENGVIRVAWQHSKDTSTFWGRVKESSVDPDFVNENAIPWLLLEKKGTQAGPTGGDKLTVTTFVQRVNTVGGVAPATGCSSPADIGRTEFVPYLADYVFYKDPTRTR